MKVIELLEAEKSTKTKEKTSIKDRVKSMFEPKKGSTELAVRKSSELAKADDRKPDKLDKLAQTPTTRRGFLKAASILPRTGSIMRIVSTAAEVNKLLNVIDAVGAKPVGFNAELDISYDIGPWMKKSWEEILTAEELIDYDEGRNDIGRQVLAARALGVKNINQIAAHTSEDEENDEIDFDGVVGEFKEEKQLESHYGGSTSIGTWYGIPAVVEDEGGFTALIIKKSDREKARKLLASHPVTD